MYETMKGCETDPSFAGEPPLMRAFAEIWQAASKIVFSRTLEAVTTDRTQIERNFDLDAISQLKETDEYNIVIGGPNLAAHAFRSGLNDECHLFLTPVIAGGGNQALPDGVRLGALLPARLAGC